MSILIKVAELIVKVLGGNSVFPNSECTYVNCEVDDRTLVIGDWGGGVFRFISLNSTGTLERPL